MEVYTFAINFAVEHQYLPTMNEISEAIYLDNNAVRKRFDKFRDLGLVEYHAASGTHRRYVMKELRISKRGGCKV